MADEKKTGLNAALDLDGAAKDLDLACAPGSKNAADDEPDLFGADRSVFGRLVDEASKAAGRGRPKGSRNRSTAELVKLISAKGRHPLIAMAEIVAMPIPDIAVALGCKLLEAAEYQRKVMSDLAPYVAQKQPVAVQVAGANAGMLVINLGTPIGEGGGSGLDMKLIEAEPEGEENQALGDEDPAPSHGRPSHVEGK